MKQKIIALITLLVASCVKKDTLLVKDYPNSQRLSHLELADGDDNEDKPILMKIVGNASMPVEGTDVLLGTTSAMGECITMLSCYGIWEISMEHSSYTPSDICIMVTDSSCDNAVRIAVS